MMYKDKPAVEYRLVERMVGMVEGLRVTYSLYEAEGLWRMTVATDSERWNERLDIGEKDALALLSLLCREGVTPCSFGDIMRDWRKMQ